MIGGPTMDRQRDFQEGRRVRGGEIQGGWEEERYREGERRRDTGRVRGGEIQGG